MSDDNKLLWTPAGRISYPHIAAPDNRANSLTTGFYISDLLIYKPTFKEVGKDFQKAVLEVGKAKFGAAFKLTDGKFKTPFKDTDSIDSIKNDAMRGAIKITAKTKNKPPVMGPRKNSSGKHPELSPDEISKIKGGDWVKFYVSVYAYDKQGNKGVSLGLQAIQFWKSDEGFGQGVSKALETIEELDIDLDEAPEIDSEIEEDSDDIV